MPAVNTTWRPTQTHSKLQKYDKIYENSNNYGSSKKTIKNPHKISHENGCNRRCFQKENRGKKLNVLRFTRWRTKTKWRLSSRVLIPLMILNVTGRAGAVESLTSRMMSLLGYPASCSVGGEARPCTLALTCWLRGGARSRGCGGGWLLTCCVREKESSSMTSSEWRYKAPPRLRVPQRSVVPNNVFRRRVDDDSTQLDCGLPSTRILQKRIIGGREARFAEFPWQAHVRISEFQCGGVLVSHWFVATAAHCVSRAHPRDIVVWLGALDTTAGSNTARKVGVIQKILHPLFQFRMTQPDRYDIALLKLSRPIAYASHILPICLPEATLELRGKSGVIAGWGKTDTSNGHTGTNLLRSATVPILSTEQCINWHQRKQITVEIHSEMICAGHSDGHQDACLGDSGGPLIVLDSGRYYLAGITSAGFGCGVDHQPGIYHNVQFTANWLRSVISPNTNPNYIDF
ncbi:serine protease 42 [Leguminivora glycinivorella]|uniref:serine protease 42 n=1 Tax=Leguminivora glycinivorella TaxID=1035111 RepID=UPI00200BC5F5|nr:serine protease 42 [Leguminivora glycinivorella]